MAMPQYLMAVDLRHVHLGSHSAFKLERQSSAPAPLFGRDWILLGSSLNRLIHIIKNPNGHRAANVIGIILGIARHKAKRRRQPVDNEQSAGNVGSKKP